MKAFETPELNVVKLDVVDVITTSGEVNCPTDMGLG